MGKMLKYVLSLFLISTGIARIGRFIRVSLLRRPVLIILCYHRVTDDSALLSPQSVPPSNFEKQLAFFLRQFDIWRLPEVEDYLKGKRELRRDSLIFTFDDGYIDNYETVKPILMKQNIPAAFFISAEPLINREPYWIDNLSYCLSNLTTEDAGVFSALNDAFYTLLNEFLCAGHDDSRGAAAKKILSYLKSVDNGERQRIMSCISGWLKKRGEWNGDSLVVNLKQATDLQMNGFIVGAHTVSHPVLSRLDYDRCREEIVESISMLSDNGIHVNCFAYPFGEDADIGDFAPRILEEAGIGIGVTTEERVVSKVDDLRLLPRKVISDQSVSRISLRLERLAWGI